MSKNWNLGHVEHQGCESAKKKKNIGTMISIPLLEVLKIKNIWDQEILFQNF